MEENTLREIISDLEMANMKLHLLSKKLNLIEDDAADFREAYEFVKNTIKALNNEEVRMEIYKLSDG